MEKTIIINIGNTIIHIEESAYELLKSYLNEVKNHFANHVDDLEIVTDIENRIAELLLEQLENEKKQVISSGNVSAVVNQMGKVQDFDTDGEEEPIAEDNSVPYSIKKLYRDMDERVIAGVCAGIAHYFNIEAKWIRLAAVLAIFLAGSSVLIYAFLWVIMPKARTRLEKMEMKGEPVNLKGFQNNLNEELLAVKERLNVVNKQAQPILAHLGIFIGEFFEWLGRFISGAGKMIFKIIATFIIFFGGLFLLTLIIGLAALHGFWDASIKDTFPFSIISENKNVLFTSVFVTFFIPVLTLVLFSIRVAFDKQIINKTLSFALLIVWLTGVAVTCYHSAKISSEFKQHAELIQTTEFETYPTYIIDIDKSKYFSKEDSITYHINANHKNQIVIEDCEDGPFATPNNIQININKSEGGVARLVQKYESQGKTFPDALQNAQNISYNFKVKDSLIVFNPRFQLKKGTTWRNQEVWLDLEVPVGTKLILKRDLSRYIYNHWDWNCRNNDNENDEYNIWVMTNDGLKCKYDLDHPEENKENQN